MKLNISKAGILRIFLTVIVLFAGVIIGFLCADKDSLDNKRYPGEGVSSVEIPKSEETESPARTGRNQVDREKLAALLERQETNKELTAKEKEREERKRIMLREMAILEDALPGNSFLPTIRTEDERERELSDIKEQQRLQQLVNDEQATQKDLDRYYTLQVKRFEDELTLIDFCEQYNNDAQVQETTPLIFCKKFLRHSDARREANQLSIASLQKRFNQ